MTIYLGHIHTHINFKKFKSSRLSPLGGSSLYICEDVDTCYPNKVSSGNNGRIMLAMVFGSEDQYYLGKN